METSEKHADDINKRTENTMHKERDTPEAREVQDRQHEDRPEGDDFKYTSEDKYLAMEQPGVTYTGDTSATATENSDFLEYDNDETDSQKFKTNGTNSRNADAFSQDDYILRDNLDLDEDQPNSISSDDAPDRNTTDETL